MTASQVPAAARIPTNVSWRAQNRETTRLYWRTASTGSRSAVGTSIAEKLSTVTSRNASAKTIAPSAKSSPSS